MAQLPLCRHPRTSTILTRSLTQNYDVHTPLAAREIRLQNHPLGDAVLAAQEDYAETSAFPELLAIYHLFGDPALLMR